MANTLNLFRQGAVGFIDWLDLVYLIKLRVEWYAAEWTELEFSEGDPCRMIGCETDSSRTTRTANAIHLVNDANEEHRETNSQ